MSTEGVDDSRRRFLLATSTVVGGAGVVALAWPFLDSLSPSAKALAEGAPVSVDISKVEKGQQITVFWRKQPVWVLSRTSSMLASLNQVTPRLADPKSEQPQQPDYCKNEYRAIKPEYLVMIGICTHLGCSPKLKAQAPDPAVDPHWLGGYLCPCHGSKYDLSGRVFTGQPAPLNMVVPPNRYANDTLVVIGEDPHENKSKA
ncbi:MAG: ubiquinol-cytochrome c reductase iron-sulfur subunit [Gammaproteobacteria bacterium]|nr:ubiquinol-cytochrome c reductase iron-sulfur subunit [Gammaproteobacteria bacterium]